MTDVRRIVTLSTTATLVGPRVSQWAYTLQPYADRGIHLQVRCERGQTRLEAVDAQDGRLIAGAAEVVSLRRALDQGGLDRAA